MCFSLKKLLQDKEDIIKSQTDYSLCFSYYFLQLKCIVSTKQPGFSKCLCFMPIMLLVHDFFFFLERKYFIPFHFKVKQCHQLGCSYFFLLHQIMPKISERQNDSITLLGKMLLDFDFLREHICFNQFYTCLFNCCTLLGSQ